MFRQKQNKYSDDLKIKCYLKCDKIKNPYLQLICMDECLGKTSKKEEKSK